VRASGSPSSALPATRPPTQAAALDPSPRAVGTRLTQASLTPLKGRPAASYACRTARTITLWSLGGSRPTPSPSIVMLTASASVAVTSL
jgi:hypothetical protein